MHPLSLHITSLQTINFVSFVDAVFQLFRLAVQPALVAQIFGHELVRVNVQRSTKQMERVDGGHLLSVLKEADVGSDATDFVGKGFLGQSGPFTV